MKNKQKALTDLKACLAILNKTFSMIDSEAFRAHESFKKLPERAQNTLAGDKLRLKYKTLYLTHSHLFKAIDEVEKSIVELKEVKADRNTFNH